MILTVKDIINTLSNLDQDALVMCDDSGIHFGITKVFDPKVDFADKYGNVVFFEIEGPITQKIAYEKNT